MLGVSHGKMKFNETILILKPAIVACILIAINPILHEGARREAKGLPFTKTSLKTLIQNDIQSFSKCNNYDNGSLFFDRAEPDKTGNAIALIRIISATVSHTCVNHLINKDRATFISSLNTDILYSSYCKVQHVSLLYLNANKLLEHYQ